MNLTLLNYNIQNRPALESFSHKYTKIGPKLEGYDLVFLQECWVDADKFAEYTNYVNKIIPNKKRNWYTPLGCGLLVMSNLKLVQQHVHIYKHFANLQDAIASKGFIMSRWLLTPDVYLTTIVCHNQADFYTCPADGPLAAMNQAIELVSYIKAYVPETDGLILIGDLNIGPKRSYDYTQYHDAGYLSNEDVDRRSAIYNYVMNSLNLVDVWDQLYPAPDNYDGFDRMGYRSSSTVTIVANSIKRNNTFVDDNGGPLSDSMPVEVNITIN